VAEVIPAELREFLDALAELLAEAIINEGRAE
jgi:hypothetical protein